MTRRSRESINAPMPARRRFLARLGIGSAAFGALVGAGEPAHAQPSPAAPRRHAVDDWMDALPAAHRMVFDATTANGLDSIRDYANNTFTANRTGYGLESQDVGVILVLRHNATPFAFNDAMWTKYGGVLGTELKLPGKPATNPANAGGGATSMDTLIGLGVHFGVCAMATRRWGGILARAAGGTIDAVFDELGKNLIRNAHLTPAGIVAVGRAQERGYTFGYAG